uniref:Uncharacterized protein n=1 Tax=Arundo donax TaxID=35708 RepID=A0A0A9EF37_ARUDO
MLKVKHHGIFLARSNKCETRNLMTLLYASAVAIIITGILVKQCRQ